MIPFKRFLILTGSVLTLFLQSCQTGNQIQVSSPDTLKTLTSIGVWVNKGEDRSLDQVFKNTLLLELIAKGYQVRDLSETGLHPENHLTAGSLLKQLKLKPGYSRPDLILLADVSAKPVNIIISHHEQVYAEGIAVSQQYLTSTEFKAKYYLADPVSEKVIIKGTLADTGRYVGDGQGGVFFKPEASWLPLARMTTKVLESVPVSEASASLPAGHSLKVSFLADNTYRKQFPDWQQRLRLRLLYANDLMVRLLGIRLEAGDFYEWDSEFHGSLEFSLNDLSKAIKAKRNEIFAGVTVDRELSRFISSRDKLGLAKLNGQHLVMTAHPSFPGMSNWNPIEEALTLVHEIGHNLGAVHTEDSLSLMFSSAGFLSMGIDSMNYAIIRPVSKVPLDQYAEKEKVFLAAAGNQFFKSAENSRPLFDAMMGSLINFQLTSGEYILYSDTVTTHKKFSALFSHDGLKWGALGSFYLETGQNKKALFYLNRALFLHPGNELFKQKVRNAESRLALNPEPDPLWEDQPKPPVKTPSQKKKKQKK